MVIEMDSYRLIWFKAAKPTDTLEEFVATNELTTRTFGYCKRMILSKMISAHRQRWMNRTIGTLRAKIIHSSESETSPFSCDAPSADAWSTHAPEHPSRVDLLRVYPKKNVQECVWTTHPRWQTTKKLSTKFRVALVLEDWAVPQLTKCYSAVELCFLRFFPFSVFNHEKWKLESKTKQTINRNSIYMLMGDWSHPTNSDILFEFFLNFFVFFFIFT